MNNEIDDNEVCPNCGHRPNEGFDERIHEQWTEVLATADAFEADLIKSELEDAEIPVSVLSKLDAMLPFIAGKSVVTRLLVPNEFESEALEIIRAKPDNDVNNLETE